MERRMVAASQGRDYGRLVNVYCVHFLVHKMLEVIEYMTLRLSKKKRKNRINDIEKFHFIISWILHSTVKTVCYYYYYYYFGVQRQM